MNSTKNLKHIGKPERWSMANAVYFAPVGLVSLLLVACCYDSAVTVLQSGDPYGTFLLTIKNVYWSFWNRVLTDPYFLVSIPLVFLIQYLLPVNRDQRLFGSATRTDMLYTAGMIVFYGVVVPPFLSYLSFVYTLMFGWLTFDFEWSLQGWSQFLIGYLTIDFLGWFHHLVRHKIPGFWEFHAIHHSQHEMNPFTNERVHPFDWIIANSIKFIPAFFFTDALQIVIGYWAMAKALDHLNHANVRTNLGWLRYIFVTPQSHRVHHSPQPEHKDTNFGVSLSIWDHLFGTQYRDYNDYPDTGIPDEAFPLEENENFRDLCVSVAHQITYPFVRVWRKSFMR